jgi:hypothetical protein
VTKLAVVQRIDAGPVAAIDDDGDAAAIWIDRSTNGLIAPDRVMQSSTSTGSWPASPQQLAPIAAPDPQIPAGGGGFVFANCGPGVLGAAVLPDGTPIAAWDSPYGSFKSHGTEPTPSDQEWAVCGVQMAQDPDPKGPGPTDPGASGPPNVGAQDPPHTEPVPNTLGNLGLLTVLPDGKTVKLTVGCSVAAVAGCSGAVGIAPLDGARISAKPKKSVSYGSTKFAGIAPARRKRSQSSSTPRAKRPYARPALCES